MNKKIILFVDDERNILKGLRRTLYPLRDDWKMLFVESGPDALETMKNNKTTILVSDMRMPGMNGFELLKTVRLCYPEIVRVMLTGQPDRELHQEVMTVSHYFLWKPTPFEVFDRLFSRIKELDTALRDEQLIKLIGSITVIPSLPTLYIRLTELLEKSETDSTQIAAVVNEDMAMVVQILKLVNSVLFGLSRQLETLEEAITYLGIEALRSLVLAQQLFSQCNHEKRQTFKLDQLWEHSFRTATLAARIAAELTKSPKIHHLAYLAGLLHDIGKLILIDQLTDIYKLIQGEVAASGRCQCEIEREKLGADHSAIGGYLVGLWGLPRMITEAVGLHHRSLLPDKNIASPVFEAVWHANRICHGNYSQSETYRKLL